MKILNMFLIFFLLTYVNTNLSAHEHEEEEKADTAYVVNGDTVAINGVAVDSAALKESHEEAHKEFQIHFFDALFDHMHNKIIHFPIALSLFAFVMLLWGWKERKYELPVKALVITAAFFAVIAVITGLNQEEAFEGTPKEWLVETHQALGISTMISLILWSILMFFNKYRWLLLIVSIIAAGLVLTTGFFGGLVAHGH